MMKGRTGILACRSAKPKVTMGIRITVILAFCCCIVACSNEGDPIHFIVPQGFEGVIQIVQDGTDSGGYRYADGRHSFTIPADGVLRVNSSKPFQQWHTISAEDTTGQTIYWLEPPAPNEQALLIRGFGSTTYRSDDGRTVHWYAVGQPDFIERVKLWSYDRTESPPVSDRWPKKRSNENSSN